MDLAGIFALLNDPVLKPILLVLGGFILKRWEPFVNKAIPVVLAVCSAVVSLIGALFPAAAGTKTAGFVLAMAVAPAGFVDTLSHVWASPIVSALVPLWLASGMQSTVKNTRQWAGAGWKIWDATRR